MMAPERMRSVSVSTGALIMVAMRWSDRLIGLVSTLILARLLVPEDFGIIAMASVVIGLIDVLLDMGVATALIQNQHARQADYDAAWTLRLLQSCIATLLIYLLASPAADYFHDVRIARVMEILALSTLLAGLENIGIISFQKNMEFGMDFRFFFIKRISGFLITLAAVWITHDYWALVIGNLGGRLVGVLLSYAIHPMRSRLNLSGIRTILAFSTWNLLRGIAGYLNESAHRLIVGRRTSSAVMGEYSLACDIAALPSTELLAPLNRVLFPAFVNVKDDPAQLRQTFLLALGIQAMIGIPAGAGMILVAHELVLTLLGEKWIAAVPFIQIMGAINIVAALSTSGGYLLLALGKAKTIALNTWLQIILFVAGAVWLIPEQGAMAIALLRLIVVTWGLFSFIYLIRRELTMLDGKSLMSSVWRPCVAAVLMSGALLLLPMPTNMPVALQLFSMVAIGAVAFISTVVALWAAAGRPAGAEGYLLDKIRFWLRVKPQRV